MIYALAGLLLLLVACRGKGHPPGEEFTFKKSGRIDGVANTDFDRVFDVSFVPNSTRVQVTVNGKALNIYEFKVISEFVVFGKQVTLNGDGTISFMEPPVPAVPAGTPYTIIFDN